MTKQFIKLVVSQDSRFDHARKIAEDIVMMRDQHSIYRALSPKESVTELGMFKVLKVLYITIHSASDLTWGRSKVAAMNSFGLIKVGDLHPIELTRVASKMKTPTWNAEFRFCMRSFRQSEYKDATILVQVWQQRKAEAETRLLGQAELSMADAHERMERRQCKLSNPKQSPGKECGEISISLRFVCVDLSTQNPEL